MLSATILLGALRDKIWTSPAADMVMDINHSGGITNNVDLDKTDPLRAINFKKIWSMSTLFVQACLSKCLGLMQYVSI